MSRKNSTLLDYGLEEEVDPKIKFNSLLSVTVSTIMCLAARCPLPRSNVETTKLFLRTITDDSGQTPRNVKGFLTLLNNYSGPYESDSCKERHFEKASVEKKPSLESTGAKARSPSRDLCPGLELPALTKRNSKVAVKKGDKDKKGSKNVGSKISASKSILSNKLSLT